MYLLPNFVDFVDSVTDKNTTKLECGPMPNLMVALPGGALCSTPQGLARAHCSTAVRQ